MARHLHIASYTRISKTPGITHFAKISCRSLSAVFSSVNNDSYPFSPASIHAEKQTRRMEICRRMAMCTGGKMIRANHHVESYPSSGSPVEHGPRYIFRFDRHVFPMSDRKMADSIAAPVSDYLLAGITTRGWTVTTARGGWLEKNFQWIFFLKLVLEISILSILPLYI